MKTIKLLAWLLLATTSAATLSACTDGFEELNVNPNQNPNVIPETLLAPALTDLVKRNMDRARRITNELMQVQVTRNEGDAIHRYVVRPAEADYMWNGWYTQLTDFRDLYRSAQGVNSPTFMAIARILEVWTVSLLTDTFGDVPYSQAIRGREGLLQPAFDKQEDIYKDLFVKLEEANELLKANINLSTDQSQLDPLYQGSAAKWRKFGNSLYLRLLVRVSNRTEAIANGMSPQDKLRDLVNTNAASYPLISNNDESAILRWTGTAPYQSPFQTFRAADFSSFSSMSQFFVNNLNEWNDPRRAKWSTLYQGTYEGIPSGYDAITQPQPAKSTYPAALMTEPLLGNILNYGEVQLLLAEAALRGWTTGNAQTYYEAGATAGITLWGYTVPTDYFTNSDVQWEASATFDRKLEQIHLQKYYALFFTDFQQWFEYRRTGHPVLPIGAGVRNDGKMPARLNYPVYVQSLNQQSYQAAVTDQGPDDVNTKVWWQK